MNNRILDISENPGRLSAGGGLLRLELEGQERREVPFTHIAAVICSHGQISFTQAVLAELAAANATLVVCDAKHLPVAMMLPLVGHTLQTVRFQAQAAAPLPLRKRLWKKIVVAKILAQSANLRRIRGRDRGLSVAAKRVRSGDASQVEATAGRVYWQLLFDDAAYRRSDDEDSRNALLNYGYAVIRAMVARALCGAGLHPGLVLHHHNQYDPFPLANDVMEPFRPLVDEWVVSWCESREGPWPLDRESKGRLLGRLTGRFTDGSENRSLFDWAERVAERLARCIEGERGELEIPELTHVEETGWRDRQGDDPE